VNILLILADGIGPAETWIYARAVTQRSAPGREWIYSWLDDKDMVRTATRVREGDGVVRDLEPSYFDEIIQGVR
jgi:hypothetical protein